MIQGTASSVGKSLLTTALCRIWARRGLRVAPFKAQNMALNSAVTPDGGEIGRAQCAQAEAARAVPARRHEPDPAQARDDLGARRWSCSASPIGTCTSATTTGASPSCASVVGAALDRLRAAYDLVVIEGAGSPGRGQPEGSRPRQHVGGRARRRAGGARDRHRARRRDGRASSARSSCSSRTSAPACSALVVNKFRGDPRSSSTACASSSARTGIRVAGVVPHLGDTRIASEDSLDLDRSAAAPASAPSPS